MQAREKRKQKEKNTVTLILKRKQRRKKERKKEGKKERKEERPLSIPDVSFQLQPNYGMIERKKDLSVFQMFHSSYNHIME